jgi:hypothetical protein
MNKDIRRPFPIIDSESRLMSLVLNNPIANAMYNTCRDRKMSQDEFLIELIVEISRGYEELMERAKNMARLLIQDPVFILEGKADG